jgi:hypothetical protein
MRVAAVAAMRRMLLPVRVLGLTVDLDVRVQPFAQRLSGVEWCALP